LENREEFERGKAVSNEANLREAEQLVAAAKEPEKTRYETWIREEMPGIVAERKKQSLVTGYPVLMEQVKNPPVRRDITPYISEEETKYHMKWLGIYRKGHQYLIDDLKDSRQEFMDLQNDKEHFGTEGSERYRNMANALNTCIGTLENKDSKPSEIRNAMKELIRTTELFRRDRTNTGARRQLVEDRLLALPNRLSYYDTLRMAVTNDKLGTRNMSYADMEKAILLERFSSEAKVKLPRNMDAMTRAIGLVNKMPYQKTLFKKLSELTSHKLCTGLTVTDPDDIVPSRKTPTAEKLATDYVITEYVIKAGDPSTTDDGVIELENKSRDGRMQQEISKLAKDKVFQAVALANPDTYYSKWNAVCKEAKYIQRDCDLEIRKYEATHIGYENTTKGTKGLDSYIEVKKGANPDPVYQSVAEHIKNQILADPVNEKLCRAIAAGQIDQKDITNDIANKMKEKKLLSNGKGIRYKSLKNGDLKAEYVAEITRSLRPRKLTTVRRPARTTGPVM
jgi:hypothetical protein